MKVMNKFITTSALALILGTTNLYAASGTDDRTHTKPPMLRIESPDFAELKTWYTSADLAGDLNPIAFLKEHSAINARFKASAHVWEGYTIEVHTAMVLARFNALRPKIRFPESVRDSINTRDFALFLSLHDIGKDQAKVEVAADPSKSAKDLEIKYSRRIFKQVARFIGMKPQTVKILSRLLHADTIGDYFKGSADKHQAHSLLVRDGRKCDVDPKDFAKLHVLFHQLDGGSYPRLSAMIFSSPDDLSYKPGTQARIDELMGRFD